MMDDAIVMFMFVLAVVCGFAVLGVLSITQDSRPYQQILTDCKQYGWIQNNHSRINCTVVEE